jgi:glutathione S-transferase
MSLRLFGHPISQPTRAVSWLLTLNKEPFEYIRVNPVGGDTVTSEFLAKFPLGYAPAIEDANPKYIKNQPLHLAEAGAILVYLCESRKWNQWYPISSTSDNSEIIRRARINEWLHWHHGALRMCTVDCFRVHMIKFMAKTNKPLKKDDTFAPAVALPSEPKKGLRKYEEAKFLAHLENSVREMIGNAHWTEAEDKQVFLAPGETPSVADLMSYCELDQLDYLDTLGDLKAKYPLFDRWLQSMKKIEQHDEVRKPLVKLVGLMKKEGALEVDVPEETFHGVP